VAQAQRATHWSVSYARTVSPSGLSNLFHPSPVVHTTGREMPPSGLSWRVAHQTYCDVPGQARPSLRRAHGQRPREQREAGPRAQASQQVWRATTTKPQKAPAFQGLVPDERNRFGRLTVLSNAPNLLRRAGTSPTIAGKHSNKTGMPSPNGGRSCWMPRKRSFWTRLKLDAIKNSREFE